MSTTHLLNNARNAIKQCNLSQDERNALIQRAVSPLTVDELNHLIRETTIAAEAAVTYHNKYKPNYETIKIKIGMIAVGINQFIITYRDKRNELKEMITDMFAAMPNLDLTKPDLIADSIRNEYFEEASDEIKETALFKWTMDYFIKLANEVIKEMPTATNTQVIIIPEEADMTTQTETNTAPEVEQTPAATETPATAATTTETTQAAPAEEVVVEEAKEKEYVQWTRDACAEAHAEGIAKGEDAAKAAKRAALMGKLVGNYHENLDKAKENDAKWETGVTGYEKRQESEKKDYVSKALEYTNPEPLLTKLEVHIVQPVVNKFLSWI